MNGRLQVAHAVVGDAVLRQEQLLHQDLRVLLRDRVVVPVVLLRFTRRRAATVFVNCTSSGFSPGHTRSPLSTLRKDSTSCTTNAVPTRLRVPSMPHATSDWSSYSGQSASRLNTLTRFVFSGTTSTGSRAFYASATPLTPTSARSSQRTSIWYWPSWEKSSRRSVEPSALKRIWRWSGSTSTPSCATTTSMPLLGEMGLLNSCRQGLRPPRQRICPPGSSAG